MANDVQLDSFVKKFKQLIYFGHTAHLEADTHAGQASVSLRVMLGTASRPKQQRRSPSYFRRQEKRKAARQQAADATKLQEAENASKQQQQQHQQQQQQQHRVQQSASIPPAPSGIFSPPSVANNSTTMPEVNQKPSNLFANGDISHSTYLAPPAPQLPANNNGIKTENLAGSHYLNVNDFTAPLASTQTAINEFNLQQQDKELIQMASTANDSLFNALAQHPVQPPVTSQLNDIKPTPPPVSSPAVPPSVSGGKPKSHSAAMAQVRNASSWSSLAGSSQQGPGGSSKSSNLVDSFQMFKRQAKEKEARQKALIEQQEMRRQQKEQQERERMRAEAERRREREEEEALEKARYIPIRTNTLSLFLILFHF